MILGIDATNIRSGGGITHLREVLRVGDPRAAGFTEVVLWSRGRTALAVEDRTWLRKVTPTALEGSLPRRLAWQRFQLPGEARRARVDVLFVPGGGASAGFRPLVTMSRNLLPFMDSEVARYGISPFSLKMRLLKRAQVRDFRRAEGVIFLTKFAASTVRDATGPLAGRQTIIPHGVDDRFFLESRPLRDLGSCSESVPLRILYVSIIDRYKHQWHVIEAVSRLRARGWSVVLDLVGPTRPCAQGALDAALAAFDAERRFVKLHGDVPHLEIQERYGTADLVVFASSCENMPNILLEGMASGLPIACSDRGPMPEVLGEGGVTFDPESATSIAQVLDSLITSSELSERVALAAVARAKTFTWARCAQETFRFLAEIAQSKARPSLDRGEAK